MNLLTIGILVILAANTFAASERITIKPFVRSRYSFKNRPKTTPKTAIKTNETVTDANLAGSPQPVSTQIVQQDSETTTPAVPNSSLEKQNGGSTILYTSTESQPTVSTTKIAATKDQQLIHEPTTSKKLLTTTQTEWIYDYYVNDDEAIKKKN